MDNTYRCGFDCPKCPYLKECELGQEFLRNWESGFSYHDGECGEDVGVNN